MAHVSYPHKKTNKAVFRKQAKSDTQDSVYWNKLGQPALVKEFGAIDHLDFSPVEPYYFAATCSVRVQVYDPITKVVAKNISQFVEGAYGATFRNDGRLLVAGSEEAVVKLFDIQSKNILRVFTGHTGPVHRTFFTKDQVKVLSCSDDKSVCVWDIATEEKIANFSEHTDYVRAGAASPISPDIILSGGYDHTVKLYDCRSNETVLTVNHGDPVESTLFLPSGGIFISAGGTQVKVWDLFNGGKLLANISQHHKTVTSLRLASNNSRLMSASLDRHIKVYDLSTFKVVHNFDLPNAILSMAISEKDDILAVGMVDGVISIRKREHGNKQHNKDESKRTFKFTSDHIPSSKVDLVVTKQKLAKEEWFDLCLRKMHYSKALANVLKTKVSNGSPEKTAAVLQELLKRNVLHPALSGLNEKHKAALIQYLYKNIGETNLMRTVIDTTNAFVDVFGDQTNEFPEQLRMVYTALLRKVKDEIDVCKRICELEGAIGMLLAGAQTATTINTLDATENLLPSLKAQRELVIDID